MTTIKLTIILSLFVALVCNGQSDSGRLKTFNLEKGLAIQGYDPVSYFTGRPMEGQDKFAYSYKSVIYFFESQSNRDQFIKNPSRYEPAYGGWCAYAMGKSGEKVKVDPETFKIIDGKVHLFYNFWGNNTLKDWNKDEESLRVSAEQQWKKYSNQ